MCISIIVNIYLQYSGKIFLSYFTDFSYFSVKKKFQKLQDTVRSGEKCSLLKVNVDSFSYFSLIFSYFII